MNVKSVSNVYLTHVIILTFETYDNTNDDNQICSLFCQLIQRRTCTF